MAWEQKALAKQFFKDNMKTPVIGYIAGLTAPKGRRTGHAGAIISAFGESAAEKVEILQECGVTIVPNPAEIGTTLKSVFGRGRLALYSFRQASILTLANTVSIKALPKLYK